MMFHHIMVVDDQEAEQMLAKYAIKEYNPNATIYTAYDGVEALEMLESMDQLLDIIFLDINMPRMNGFEFLEAYGATSAKALVLIMLTSSDQDSDRERCASFEYVTGYETKPVSAEMIRQLEAAEDQGV